MEKLRTRGKVKGRLGIDCRVCINSVTGPWWSLNGLSSAPMVCDTSRATWLNYSSSIDRSISVIWLLYSPASSSYKGKLWWQGMLSWHFLSGANQCKSWIAFVDISQGEKHGRYHCHSLIAMKRQKRGDKHTWIYNVQPFELGTDEGCFQIKHTCILTPYIHSFQVVHSYPPWQSEHWCCQKLLPLCIWLRGRETCWPCDLVRTEQSASWKCRKSSQAGPPLQKQR